MSNLVHTVGLSGGSDPFVGGYEILAFVSIYP